MTIGTLVEAELKDWEKMQEIDEVFSPSNGQEPIPNPREEYDESVHSPACRS